MTELSMYEQFNPLTTVTKQRFVELFQGDAIDADRWVIDNVVGTGSIGMVDVINEGAFVKSGTTASDITNIDFGAGTGTRHYDFANSVFIASVRRVNDNSDLRAGLGLDNMITSGRSTADFINSTANTFTLIGHNDATAGGSTTSSTTPIHKNWSTVKLVLSGSSISLDEDGIQTVSSTSGDYPTEKMQPTFVARNITSQAETRVRYCEAWNV